MEARGSASGGVARGGREGCGAGTGREEAPRSRDSPTATAPPATRSLGRMPDAAERGARILEPGDLSSNPAAPPSLPPVFCKMGIKFTGMVQ